jgi:hypothetical protein
VVLVPVPLSLLDDELVSEQGCPVVSSIIATGSAAQPPAQSDNRSTRVEAMLAG